MTATASAPKTTFRQGVSYTTLVCRDGEYDVRGCGAIPLVCHYCCGVWCSHFVRHTPGRVWAEHVCQCSLHRRWIRSLLLHCSALFVTSVGVCVTSDTTNRCTTRMTARVMTTSAATCCRTRFVLAQLFVQEPYMSSRISNIADSISLYP